MKVYSTKSNASRAAIKAGIPADQITISANEGGGYTYSPAAKASEPRGRGRPDLAAMAEAVTAGEAIAVTASPSALDAKVEELCAVGKTNIREAILSAIEYGRSTRTSRRPVGRIGQSKREQAAALLTRPEGATARDVLDLTGWPTVSIPQLAKSSGIALRSERDGRALRYYGEAA
jgi:hypothetical protein